MDKEKVHWIMTNGTAEMQNTMQTMFSKLNKFVEETFVSHVSRLHKMFLLTDRC